MKTGLKSVHYQQKPTIRRSVPSIQLQSLNHQSLHTQRVPTIKPADLIIEKTAHRGQLWLGNLNSATDKTFLKTYNIKAVLTASNNCKIHYSDIAHITLPIDDDDEFQIHNYFEQSNAFIEFYQAQGNVLVHCHAGISRSAVLVIAYIMKQTNTTYAQASQLVGMIRPLINPNEGFIAQLIEYESQCVPIKQRLKLDLHSVEPTINSKANTGRRIIKKEVQSDRMIKVEPKQFRIKVNKMKTQQ